MKYILSYCIKFDKYSVKRVLRKLLFEILEKEDDYIQIHVIIHIKKVGKLSCTADQCTPIMGVLLSLC